MESMVNSDHVTLKDRILARPLTSQQPFYIKYKTNINKLIYMSIIIML